MNEQPKRRVVKVVSTFIVLAAMILGWRAWRGHSTRSDGAMPEARATPVLHRRAVVEAWKDSNASRGLIAGRVIEPGGRAVSGALVSLIVTLPYEEMEDNVSFRPLATQVSAADGAFSFPEVPAGPYMVTATASGWAPAEKTGITMVAGERLSGLELRLAAAAHFLSGTVSDAVSGPIAGAAVRALLLGPGGRPESSRTYVSTTDGRGEFALGLPIGGYRVVAHANGYAPATTTLWLERNQRHQFRLSPAARISGVVLRDARPVAGAAVRLGARGQVGAAPPDQADGLGREVRIHGRPAGQIPGLGTIEQPGRPDAAAATTNAPAPGWPSPSTTRTRRVFTGRSYLGLPRCRPKPLH